MTETHTPWKVEPIGKLNFGIYDNKGGLLLELYYDYEDLANLIITAVNSYEPLKQSNAAKDKHITKLRAENDDFLSKLDAAVFELDNVKYLLAEKGKRIAQLEETIRHIVEIEREFASVKLGSLNITEDREYIRILSKILGASNET